MNVIFLGSFYPENRFDEILHKSKYIDFAGNTFQWNLLKGFSSLGICVNTFTIPTTKKLKGLYLKGSSFSLNNNLKGESIEFWDIKGFKQIDTSFKLLHKLLNITDNYKYLIIYSLQNNLLRAAYFYKKIYPNTKIILIITDLSEYMSASKNLIYNFLKKLEIKDNQKFIDSVDGFILLTKQMAEKLKIKDKPFIVMEGIFNENYDISKKITKKNKIKTILYSGTLDKRYGIIKLVESFHAINDYSLQLIIIGDGDSKKEIIKYNSIDSRIKYMGKLKRCDVLEMQRNSNLLINPRQNDKDYVKYSFPSKILEYFASGTPTLMYNLPGIPSEYYDYCYTVEKVGNNSLKDAIINIFNKDESELEKIGENARIFILNNKNSRVQCSKIINFLSNI